VVKLNLIKLVIRSLLFVATIALYLFDNTFLLDTIHRIGANDGTYLLAVIWIVFMVEMIFRFFPSKYESMGCQKQFEGSFVQNDHFPATTDIVKSKHLESAVSVAVFWIVLNVGIAVFFFNGIIDEATLLIVSLFFAVCDIICILFYCPFQSLIMKNRCCITCRIYNWDFLMMFMPLVFIASWYTLSLFAVAMMLFIKWEVTYYKHPEWFCDETNLNLRCASCKEELCVYKKVGKILSTNRFK